MPANVTMKRDGKTGFGVNGNDDAAWHNLVPVVGEVKSISELLRLSGVDGERLTTTPTFHPSLAPIEAGHFLTINKGDTPENVIRQLVDAGILVEADGFKTIVRDGLEIDDAGGTALHVATDIYKPISISEALAPVQPLVDAQAVDCDAFTLLGDKGSRFAATFRLRDGTVEIRKGDVQRRYISVLGSHDGTMALRFLFTLIRTICENTVSAALSRMKAGDSAVVRHSGNVKQKVIDAAKFMAEATKQIEAFEDWQRKLLEVELTNRHVVDFANFLFPEPEKKPDTDTGAKRSATMRQNKIDALVEAVRIEKRSLAELPQWTATRLAANNGKPVATMYELFNGLTRAVDHVYVGNRTGGDAVDYSTWGGGGASLKAKGIAQIAEMAGFALPS